MIQVSVPIGKGHNADIYDNGDGTVTKVYHADMPEHLYSDDYHISLLVSKYYNNMPKIYGLREGTPYPGIVLEKIEGVNLRQKIMQNPLKIIHYAREFARIHSEISQTVVKDLPKQKKILTEKIGPAAGTGIDQAAIVSFLNSLPDGDFLCHNDFMPTNAVCSKDCIIVIDWRTASMGDPCSDIARTLILNKVPRKSIGISPVEDLLRRIFCHIYFSHYIKLSGYSKKRVREWLIPQAAIRLLEDISEAEKMGLMKLIQRGLKMP